MLVYLDQNKWIELARAYYGKDKSQESQKVLSIIKRALAEEKIILPLSSNHYMETARISNAGRKARLGKVMWRFSRGYTLVSYRNIVINECENALSKFFNNVQKSNFKLVGHGIENAFGEVFKKRFPPAMKNIIEESLLTGELPGELVVPKFDNTKYRKQFAEHLRKLPIIKQELPPDKWDDAIYAIVMVDIREPLVKVMVRSNIRLTELESLGVTKLRSLIDSMPSRSIDVHLHRQMLKNPSIVPKESDLEDWAGLGVAAQYCDLVICEKHFANLVKRDEFHTKASVETNFSVLKEL